MAIVVKLPGVTREQFDAVGPKLRDTAPPELLVHVSFEAGDKIEAFQVWESEEAWGADMPRVLPILAEAGIDASRPPEAAPAVLIAGSKVAQEVRG